MAGKKCIGPVRMFEISQWANNKIVFQTKSASIFEVVGLFKA